LGAHGVQVFDTHKVFDANLPHAIILPGQIQFPLQLHGIISFLETKKPLKEELLDCDRFELTSAASWNPYAEYFQQKEDLLRQRNASAATRHTPLELIEDVLPRLVQAIHISPSPDRSQEQDSILLDEDDCRNTMAVGQSSRATVITEEDLARRWHIGLEAAARTLTATTQLGMRYVDGPLERRLRTSQHHMRFPTLNMQIYTDTLVAKFRSTRGYLYVQVFTNGRGFLHAYPLEEKGDACHALSRFIRHHGIPRDLTSDRAPEEMHGEWGCLVNQYHITQTTT
jgi:hypothetical protein